MLDVYAAFKVGCSMSFVFQSWMSYVIRCPKFVVIRRSMLDVECHSLFKIGARMSFVVQSWILDNIRFSKLDVGCIAGIQS